MFLDPFYVDLNSIHSKIIFDRLFRESGPVCSVIKDSP